MPSSQANVGSATVRPNRVCNGGLSNRTMQEWFNTACFPQNLPNTFGTSGRNVIIGPGAQLWNMSLERIFRLRKHFDFTLRGEFYSVFNHQNWGNPSVSATSSLYGQITSKANPRVVQLVAKFRF